MAALALLLVITLAVAHWLLEPLLELLLAPLELTGLPWLLMLAGVWLLAGGQQE